MSAHNHDEEIIRRMNQDSKTAKALRKKADKRLNDTIVDAVLKIDIKGLTKEEALKKLENAIDDEVERLTGDQ